MARVVLFAAALMTLLGQAPAGQYEDLRKALNLSDAQLSHIRRVALPGVDTVDLLDEAQMAKLAEIGGVLRQPDAAAFAVAIGLIADGEWHGGCLCAFYNRVSAYRYSRELGITDAQAQRLDRILQSVKGKDRRDPALAILDEAQRAKLATIEAGVQLYREAMELGLFPRVGSGECLCP